MAVVLGQAAEQVIVILPDVPAPALEAEVWRIVSETRLLVHTATGHLKRESN